MRESASSDFDLDARVGRWRARQQRMSSLSPRELDELEDHFLKLGGNRPPESRWLAIGVGAATLLNLQWLAREVDPGIGYWAWVASRALPAAPRSGCAPVSGPLPGRPHRPPHRAREHSNEEAVFEGTRRGVVPSSDGPVKSWRAARELVGGAVQRDRQVGKATVAEAACGGLGDVRGFVPSPASHNFRWGGGSGQNLLWGWQAPIGALLAAGDASGYRR